jgi:hypothetical protein
MSTPSIGEMLLRLLDNPIGVSMLDGLVPESWVLKQLGHQPKSKQKLYRAGQCLRCGSKATHPRKDSSYITRRVCLPCEQARHLEKKRSA